MCTAFCTSPQSHRSSSLLPITFSHLLSGPRPVTMYTSPFKLCLFHHRCFGFVCTENSCLMPAVVTRLGLAATLPPYAAMFALLSASSLRSTPLCHFTHICCFASNCLDCVGRYIDLILPVQLGSALNSLG